MIIYGIIRFEKIQKKKLEFLRGKLSDRILKGLNFCPVTCTIFIKEDILALV
jgi:hypothetical protein